MWTARVGAVKVNVVQVIQRRFPAHDVRGKHGLKHVAAIFLGDLNVVVIVRDHVGPRPARGVKLFFSNFNCFFKLLQANVSGR